MVGSSNGGSHLTSSSVKYQQVPGQSPAAAPLTLTSPPSGRGLVPRYKYLLLALAAVTVLLYFVGAPVLIDRSGVGNVSPSATASSSLLLRHIRYQRPRHAPAASPLKKLIEKIKTPSPKPAAIKNVSTPFTLFDFPNFTYIINNDVCGGGGGKEPAPPVFLVSFIHSAPGNRANRDAIRSSWGNHSALAHRGLTQQTVFLLAAVRDAATQRSIEGENERYHDIVQGNFRDAYKNLTYKHAMGLHWVSSFCAHAKFVLKTDDDIFVDMYQLVDVLGERGAAGQQDLVLCNQWVGMPVLRDKKSKWYVSEREHAANTFSPYCSGWAYLLTPASSRKVFLQSFTTRYFWVDDWLVSGPMVDSAGLKRSEFNQHYVFGVKELYEWLGDGKPHSQCRFIFGPTWSDSSLMDKLWRKTVAHEMAAEHKGRRQR